MKTVYPINQPPTPDSRGDIWDAEEAKDHATFLRLVIHRRPDAHPIWHDYVLSLVHLRPVEGQPPAYLQYEDSTHEIACFALDPDHNNQPKPLDYKVLTPANLIYQLRGLTDDQAKQVFGLYLTSLTNRFITPDTDYRSAQIAVLRTLQEGVLAGD